VAEFPASHSTSSICHDIPTMQAISVVDQVLGTTSVNFRAAAAAQNALIIVSASSGLCRSVTHATDNDSQDDEAASLLDGDSAVRLT